MFLNFSTRTDMSGPDSYYTPALLAEKLVSYVPFPRVRSAVDFCVGDGDLLKAVGKRYDGVDMFGTDISDDAIERLRSNCPHWQLGVCDFRDEESVSNVRFLQDKTFDLIVLNPPFTCRGSVVEKVVFDKQEFRISTAMLFLVRALQYLSEDGGLYAILPISCVYSDKDKTMWDYLKKNYNACVLDEPSRVSFSSKCSPNIAMVYVGRYPIAVRKVKAKSPFVSLPVESIVRGSCRMQNLEYVNSSEGIPLIHTTNIQKGELVNLQKINPKGNFTVKQYGVVVPRVCNPNPNKVALLDGNTRYVLSDCVIAFLTESHIDAELIRNSILDNWDSFVGLYKGTGAQYTTISRLKEHFGSIECI